MSLDIPEGEVVRFHVPGGALARPVKCVGVPTHKLKSLLNVSSARPESQARAGLFIDLLIVETLLRENSSRFMRVAAHLKGE